VHILLRNNDDMRTFIRERSRSRGIPDVEMDGYGAPGGELAPAAAPPDTHAPTSRTSGSWRSTTYLGSSANFVVADCG
jgi:hypothetical protein